MFGGSANFHQSKSPGSSGASSYLYINPQIGYFVADNLAIGTWFGINSFGSSSSWSVSPFVRYYLKNFYGQASFGFNKSGTYNSIAIGGDVGYAIFLNDNVALEPAIYFSQGFYEGSNSGYSYGMKLGFQIYLNR